MKLNLIIQFSLNLLTAYLCVRGSDLSYFSEIIIYLYKMECLKYLIIDFN